MFFKQEIGESKQRAAMNYVSFAIYMVSGLAVLPILVDPHFKVADGKFYPQTRAHTSAKAHIGSFLAAKMAAS